MPFELDNDTRRTLGLAVQVLEDLPDWLQPASNMRDMRSLLDGKSTTRDEVILAEAAAVALIHRTIDIVESEPFGPNNAEVYSTRLHEFHALLAVLQRADPWTLAIFYAEMCDKLARSRQEQQ
jgi:hypothetical protein